jgi:hypothetical protein
VGPSDFGDRTFDDHVVYLSVVVCPSPLIFEVGIGASGNSEDCAVGGEVFALLWWFTDFVVEVVELGWVLACFSELCYLALGSLL